VFVIKQGVLAELLKSDPASKLQELRRQVQREFNLEYKSYQNSTAQFARYLFESGAEIGLRNVRRIE
jgi:hypothetical protein